MGIRLIFFIVSTVLVSVCMIPSNESNIFQKLGIENLTLYSGEKEINGEGGELNGIGYTYSCSVNEYSNLTKRVQIDGVSFETTLHPNEIIKIIGAKIVEKQRIVQNESDYEIFYCYVENVNNYVMSNNKRVNLQIAFNGERTIVGIPLILGSY